MVFMAVGMVSDVRFLAFKKAELPIAVTVLGKVYVSPALHFGYKSISGLFLLVITPSIELKYLFLLFTYMFS